MSPQDKYAEAVQQAIKMYPWLATLGTPIRLTAGTGPGMSESFDPKSEDQNPFPGNFTVQMRDPRIVNDPSTWPKILGVEGLDYMARHDPTFEKAASGFRQLMTPRQVEQSQRRYFEDQKKFNVRGSFEDFMKDSQLQEYIRGYISGAPNWLHNAGYTPQQIELLENLKRYMWKGQKPQTIDLPGPQ